MSAATDLNLLFGILALQADLISQEQFVEGCAVWSAKKNQPLADILVERGWLAADDRALVDRLVSQKLKKHGGDPAASLAEAVSPAILQSLAAIGDIDIDSTLAPEGPQRLATLGGTGETVRSKYTMTRLHATGGLGRVWLAHDAGLDRDVALKELLPNRSQSAEALARFLREARITGQLEHPGIVPVYELIADPNLPSPIYTMRFIRGATLAEAFAGYHRNRASGRVGPLELRELLGAFVSICQAVAYAHSRRVIHRDLKPANIVLGDFGEVMVLDWGIAKILGEADPRDPGATRLATGSVTATAEEDIAATRAGSVLGTPSYMAPEQAEGRIDDIDERTDVHGLGAILYELLTGRTPFEGASVTEVLANVIGKVPVPPTSISPDASKALEAICLKCLQKKRENRFAGAKEIAGEVQRYLADEPLLSYRDSARVRAARWIRHHKTVAASLAVGILVALPVLSLALILVSSAASSEREARVRADESAAREKAARATAEDNFQKAVRSAELVSDELARGIKPIAGTQSQTVADILGRAEKVYDELLQSPDPPARVRASKAKLLVLLSEVYRGMNRLKDAETRADAAIRIYDELLAVKSAEEREYRIELGRAHHRRGWAIWDRGLGRKALVDLERSAKLLQSANLNADGDTDALFSMASAITISANIHLDFGDTATAKPLYERGLKLREDLLARSPDDPTAQVQVAISCERLGLLLTSPDRSEAGTKLLRRAVSLAESAFSKDRSNHENARHSIRSLSTLAQTVGTAEEADKLSATARNLAETFARRDPDDNMWERENLRQQFIAVGGEKKKWGSMTEPQKIDLTRRMLALLHSIFAVCEKRLTVSADSALWISDRGNIAGRLADEYFTLARLGVERELNLKRGLELTDLSAEVYRQSLLREPESHELAVGLHYALYIATNIALAIRADADALRRHWYYLATINRHYGAVARKFPDNKFIARESSLMSLRWWLPQNFKGDWRELADETALGHLFDLLETIPDPAQGEDEANRKRQAGKREHAADLLRRYEEKKPLPERGRKLLERFSKPTA